MENKDAIKTNSIVLKKDGQEDDLFIYFHDMCFSVLLMKPTCTEYMLTY